MNTMSDLNFYNHAKYLYLFIYTHIFCCVSQLILNILLFTVILIVILPKLYIYESLYFIYTDIIVVIILIISVVGIISSIFGFISSLKKNYISLTMYGSLLFLLFMVDIALIITYFSFIYFEVFDTYCEKQLILHFSLFNNNDEPSRNLVDNIQQNLQCCGINGPVDYKNGTIAVVPVSCCPNKECKNILSIYLKGCLETLLNHPIPGSVFINSVFLLLVIIKILSLLTTLKYVLKLIDLSKTNVLQSL